MKDWLQKEKNFLISAVVFVLTFIVYLFTLAPTITMEDSGELVAAAYTLGIAHPSGFPLYVILGKLFTLIPLGSIAFRLNLMSAFFGALTVTLLYLIIYKLIKNRLIAFCLSLVLAFSPIFWSQSIVSEVYTLNTFFVTWLILILLKWQSHRQNKYLLGFAYLFGLSLTNHTMLILLAPAFALYILLVDKKIIKNWRLILKIFFLFIAGLAVYFYLPLRAWQEPLFHWGPIDSWQDVWAHISRQQYNDFAPLTNLFSKIGIFFSFFLEIYQQFFLPTLFLALGGLIYLFRKNFPMAILTIGIFLFNSLGIIYLRKFGWGLGIEHTYRVYYLPAFLMVIIWLAIIINYLYSFLSQVLKNHLVFTIRIFQLIFFLIIISLPLSFLVGNFQKIDMSNFWFNYDYAKNLLASLKPDSIYYFTYDGSLQGDTELFSLVYLKMVEKFRPDVIIVSEQGFFRKQVNLGLPASYFKLSFEERRKEILNLLANIKDHPLYVNFALTLENNDLGLFSLSNGYAHLVYSDLKAAKQAKVNGFLASLRNLAEISETSDYATRGLAAHYYYNLAAFYLIKGNLEESQIYLIKAFNLDTAPFNHEYRRFLEYRHEWLKG